MTPIEDIKWVNKKCVGCNEEFKAPEHDIEWNKCDDCSIIADNKEIYDELVELLDRCKTDTSKNIALELLNSFNIKRGTW